MNQQQISKEIIAVCQSLYGRNMLAGADGNVSYRFSDDNILITPSKLPKALIQTSDMAVMALDGRVLQGHPSSESKMHLQVYKSCLEAKCVIHAHPPAAVAWSVAFPQHSELPNDILAELIINVGSVPIVPFAIPGTQEMGGVLERYLPKHRVMILARHGALSWGEDLTEAMIGMERVEHAAVILSKAMQLGGLTTMPKNVVDDLWRIRKLVGPKSY